MQNSITHRHYIGSTSDIVRRINEHNRGQTQSTRQKGEWVLKYSEEYVDILDARNREHQIKAYKGGNAFKKLISAGIVHR